MIYPKIVRGGNAIPIGDNLFLMKGRKHKNGGIDIGKDLEVEGGEVMQTSPNEIKVFSAQKFLGGESPAELILSGANPDKVFAIQEKYKDIHGINDDGTKKKARWGIFERLFRNKKDNTQPPVKGEDIISFDNLKLTNGRSYVPQYLTDIYNGLIKRGFTKNQAIVLAGTMAEESGGDVFAKSDDKKYTGLLQWEDARYKVQYPEDREKETNSQLDYIANTIINAKKRKNEGYYDDWTDGGENSGYNSWTDAYNDFNDSTNVYNMTRGLNTGYVRPKGGIKGNTGSIINRMNAAKQIFENNGITDLRYEPDKKQYGGMTNKENNANILGYVPSTGKRKKASMGKNLVIYSDGTTHYTTDDDYDEHQVDWNKTDIYQGERKLKRDYWLTTGLGALGRTAAGVTGAIINNATNRKYLGQMEGLINKMKAYQIPLTKLKTHYNINPQLAEIENALRIGKNDIDANTASSQVALARKRAINLNAILEKNKLHGQKENIETELINKDKLQQAQTIAENVRNAQNVENQKLQMLADIVDKRAENASATTQNIVGSVVGGADSILNGANIYAQMLAGMAKSPNGANAIYGNIGRQQRERKLKKKNNNKNAG